MVLNLLGSFFFLRLYFEPFIFSFICLNFSNFFDVDGSISSSASHLFHD